MRRWRWGVLSTNWAYFVDRGGKKWDLSTKKADFVDAEERPAELRQEIFELLFDAANIATFAPEDKIKYEFAMTTERDIRNQIRYAEKQGIEQGIAQGKEQKAIEIARNLLALGVDVDTIARSSGLTEAQIEALKAV